ncbi:class I SAM-dependent methyltransferase [Streptomyces zagrosensis]|uniref:SAM-dependent methyltransferase n=1 Tax=Streptomyces zagrosensis TaxID=1042984 RepID=A0A7W9QC42_9ACTN|nr:class I SAM-dependent methyltransferase [Streptomyces zagrosensis]MBB5937415.1 SAM-dependent methyltransferase [Streptomyces zagrosensis]
MTESTGYVRAWEEFWRDAPPEPGGVLWDAPAQETVAHHLPMFEEQFDVELPLIDVGCGNGTQSRYLAQRFGRVLGVDLSHAAIARARGADRAGVAEYRQLDAANLPAVRALHAELGDANVYLRGVLHQCDSRDLPRVAEAIALLVGERGRAFVVELAEEAGRVLRGLAQGPAGPPPKLAAVFQHGIAPGEVSDQAIPALLTAARLRVLASGELPLATTESGPDGERIVLPSAWWLVARGA